jgi:hypothetical protein
MSRVMVNPDLAALKSERALSFPPLQEQNASS